MTEPLAFWNGTFVPQSQARLALNDAGFVWGATVTDLCRTFRHRLFRLEDHLARFRRSCTLARVPQPLDEDRLAEIARELVDHNARLLAPGQDLALVLFATPGEVGYYLGRPGGPGDGPPTLGLHTFPLPFARYARLFREGARLIVPATRHVPPACVPPQVKQRSRLHWWLAEQEAQAADPRASALLLDPEGYVTETAAANVLLVRGGRVLTPARRRVLDGVSLRVAEELCAALGIPFAEADLRADDLAAADEVMLASTPYCLAPVSRINGEPVPTPGPVFERLLSAWSAAVGVDIRRQILDAPGA
jgi:branched-subunit amino acid aminotransferase/4-amino-4-deoxychorismate lyase